MFARKIKLFFVRLKKWRRKVIKYVWRLFIPEGKSFLQIIWWNMKFSFFFVLVKDFFFFVFNKYLYICNLLYEKFLLILDNYVSKISRNLSWFFYYIATFIYKIVSFELFKNIFLFFYYIVKNKQSYDSYYWIFVDLWRDFVLMVLDFILYLFTLHYAKYVYKFYKFFIVEVVIGGFWGLIIWFIRFRIIGCYVRRNLIILWYHFKLLSVIHTVQHELRGFFYISELEPYRWWGFNDRLKESFKEVLRGTELDMEAEIITFFHWVCQRYVWLYFFRSHFYVYYFNLFFYVLWGYFVILLKFIYNLLKILYIKYFNRTVKFRYLFKKCRI